MMPMLPDEREAEPADVARLVVAGVGGAGGNAIRGMLRAQMRGVEFLAINTDAQALALTGALRCLRIGERLTRGLGAGGNPEIGLRAAEESRDAIRSALTGVDMVFVTAGMGGGTGTGASPAVALTARDLGALTVAIVSTPFAFEGQPRRKAAERGLAALREQVDTLIVVPNERLLCLAGKTMRMSEAYAMADEVLRQSVQAISDLIAVPGHINLDFADVRAVMADTGSAWMSVGQASGDERGTEALRAALTNSVLDVDITGARAVLVNISAGPDLMIHEVGEIVESLQRRIHPDANIVFGTVEDPALEGQIRVTLVAAGFEPRVARAGQAIAASPGAGRPSVPQGSGRLSGPTTAPMGQLARLRPAHVVGGDALAAQADDAAPDAAQGALSLVGGPDGNRPRTAGNAAGMAAGETAAHAASYARPPVWPADGSFPDDLDEPRVGQARVRPATQAADADAHAAGNGLRGIDLPSFLHRRR